MQHHNCDARATTVFDTCATTVHNTCAVVRCPCRFYLPREDGSDPGIPNGEARQ